MTAFVAEPKRSDCEVTRERFFERTVTLVECLCVGYKRCRGLAPGRGVLDFRQSVAGATVNWKSRPCCPPAALLGYRVSSSEPWAIFKYLALSGRVFFLKPSAILQGLKQQICSIAMSTHRARSWGGFQCKDTQLKQIDAPSAIQPNLGSFLQAVVSFWILTPGFWIP